MTAAKKFSLISEHEYITGELESETKHEFIDGVIYAMAGAKNRHNRIATNTLVSLYNSLRNSPCDAFNSDTKVRIKMRDHTRFYYPDAMVVCDANLDDETFQDRPVVIVEVASDSTRRIDEGEKKDAYLTIATLGTYLIIDQSSPAVIAWHRRPDSGFERVLYEANDVGQATIIPLPEISAELSLDDIFTDVEW